MGEAMADTRVKHGRRLAVRDRVHLAVDAATAGLTPDDLVLAGALACRGITVEPVVWGADLPAGSTLVLRSVVGLRRPAGSASTRWLATLDADGVDVHNPTATVRWNMHKGYLSQLAGRGVPTVPTTLVAADRDRPRSRGDHERRRLERRGRQAGDRRHRGRRSRRVERHGRRRGAPAGAGRRRGHPRATVRAVGARPRRDLDRDHRRRGADDVVRKVPADGDWRVQSEFGGTAERIAVEPCHRAFAATVLAAIDPVPLCTCAVDVVAGSSGDLLLLELELVEPELFFRLAPDAASCLVDALHGSGGP